MSEELSAVIEMHERRSVPTIVWVVLLASGLGIEILSHVAFQRPFLGQTEAAETNRVSMGSFGLYIFGLSLLLCSGSAILIRLYCGRAMLRQAERPNTLWDEIARRRQLFVGLHILVFGAIVLSMTASYFAPETQKSLLGTIHNERRGGEGPLGLAGKAYASGNVPYAAAVTLGVNFFLGTLLTMTVPSLILPGVGALLVLIRAGIAGLALAPTSYTLARGMIPHSVTLLLEFEAYVFAMFFAVLVPIYLLDPKQGETAAGRYRKAVVLNLKITGPVLVLLAVSAVYEAIEVIAMTALMAR